jgi:hypothetical protein
MFFMIVILKELTWFTKGLRPNRIGWLQFRALMEGTDLIYEGITTTLHEDYDVTD